MKTAWGSIAALAAIVFFACSQNSTVSPSDKAWLFVPQDLPDSVVAGFVPQKNSMQKPLFFKKTNPSLSGFSAVFVQKLADAKKRTISFTCQVSYARSETDARAFFSPYLAIDSRMNAFVKKADAKHFGADDVLLIQSDSLLYLALRKQLIIYFVQIENLRVDVEAVKDIIAKKISYLEAHADEFRTR